MKLSKRTTNAIACLCLVAEVVMFILQIIFLTLKISGIVSWSWWVILTPACCIIGLVPAITVIAVLVLAPKVLIENIKRRQQIKE